MTVVWGIVGVLVGVVIAAQLTWTALNFDLPEFTLGACGPCMRTLSSSLLVVAHLWQRPYSSCSELAKLV